MNSIPHPLHQGTIPSAPSLRQSAWALHPRCPSCWCWHLPSATVVLSQGARVRRPQDIFAGRPSFDPYHLFHQGAAGASIRKPRTERWPPCGHSQNYSICNFIAYSCSYVFTDQSQISTSEFPSNCDTSAQMMVLFFHATVWHQETNCKGVRP